MSNPTPPQSSPLSFLKDHWFIIVAILACGTAWGQQQEKITRLESAMVQIKEQDAKITTIKEQAILNEERLRQVQQQLDLQGRYLRALVDANPAARSKL